jgi:RES domain-containing protein
MIDLPGDHPLPHTELSAQNPLIFTLPTGGLLYRHYQKISNPIHFGKTGAYRFDDPDCPNLGCFGVLYVGADPECCLLESCGSTTGVPAVSGAYLNARAIAKIELTEPLRFIDLVSDGGLASIGADGRLVTGSYRVAQRWSAALRQHPCKPDGIRYRSRHAPERIAYSIYERSPATFVVTSMGSFTDPGNEALFQCILKTYNLALM